MSKPPKLPPRLVVAGAAIAAAVGTLSLLFAYTAGWTAPGRISGDDVANALEHNAGRHAGYRRAHAKGLCFSGFFDANGQGVALSRATAFKAGHYPIFGRFSMAGGNPFAPDGRNVFHSMALILRTPDGQEWRMGMDHTEIFPVADAASFVALQRATAPNPVTGKPDPDAVAAFMAHHAETRAFKAYISQAPLPDSFTDGPYYSINAFRFVNAEGQERFVRWSMQPEAPVRALDKTTLMMLPRDAVFDKTLAQIKAGPARWHMIVTIAAPGDVTDNATVRWPHGRVKVDVGTLVIDHAVPEEAGGCRDYTFDPTILPPGIAPSDDPLLAARSTTYHASFNRRAAEGAGESAIGQKSNQERKK